MPLADHVGRPQTVEALGQTWTLARWNRRVWVDLLEYAATKLPDPRQVAADFLRILPPEETQAREAVVSQALMESLNHLSIGSPRVQSFIGSPDGGTRLLYLLLKPNHPDITEDDAFDLFMSDPGKMQAVAAKCAGQAPGKDDRPGESAPNQPAPTGR